MVISPRHHHSTWLWHQGWIASTCLPAGGHALTNQMCKCRFVDCRSCRRIEEVREAKKIYIYNMTRKVFKLKLTIRLQTQCHHANNRTHLGVTRRRGYAVYVVPVMCNLASSGDNVWWLSSHAAYVPADQPAPKWRCWSTDAATDPVALRAPHRRDSFMSWSFYNIPSTKITSLTA